MQKGVLGILLASLQIVSLNAQEDLLSLDLEDLAQIKTAKAYSTLIRIDKKYSPSTITTITQKQIQESGARTLDELLEIYAPDIAYMYKVEGNQLGINGIISDRNNKVLMVVNGRMLNVKSRDGGAITERFFPLLGDIEEVQVLSGPGAVIYGPGAIAGVVSITTFDANTFEGLQTNAAVGEGEEYGYVDMKYAQKLLDDIGVFVYAGIDKYNGIDAKRVKNRFAFDYPDKDIQSDRNFPHPTVNLNGWFNKGTRKKLHLQIEKGDLEFWSRFSQDSLATPTYQHFYTSDNTPAKLQHTGMESDQWCSVLNYKQRFSKLTIDYSASYLLSELEKDIIYSDEGVKKINEENLNLKVLLTYNHSHDISYATGIEYTKNRFKNYQNDIMAIFNAPKSWNSELASAYGEAQIVFSERFITIFDGRIDKHTYTDPLFSGRIAAIYKTTQEETLKLNFSRSNRHIDEVDLYQQVNEFHKTPDTESIERMEFIYDRSDTEWKGSFKTTYNIENVVAYNQAINSSELIGKAKFYTLEGSLGYHDSKFDFTLSHLYTKLVDFSLAHEQIPIQNVSANPYGYGNNLANWNTNITKLRFDYQIDRKWKFISSLRVFWGLEGAKDMANYNKSTHQSDTSARYKLPYYDTGTKAFGTSAYLNLSLKYRLDEKTVFYLHGYNLLGLVDEELNKRNYFQTSSNYFIDEPAVSFSLNYKFF